MVKQPAVEGGVCLNCFFFFFFFFFFFLFFSPTPPQTPPSVVYSTDRSKAGSPVLVLLFVALVYSTRRFVYIFALCHLVPVFFSPLALRLPRLGKCEPILVLFVRLFDLRLFGFVCFLFLLVSEKGCGL